MGNRLRGMVSAYKIGRLDEFIILRFGSYKGYEEYVLRRSRYSYYKGIPVVETGWLIQGRHSDPTIMLCPDCGWTGQLKDCTHTYIQTNGEDVEPASNCPKCGGSDIFPKK